LTSKNFDPLLPEFNRRDAEKKMKTLATKERKERKETDKMNFHLCGLCVLCGHFPVSRIPSPRLDVPAVNQVRFNTL
jgi:hypothetical protein